MLAFVSRCEQLSVGAKRDALDRATLTVQRTRQLAVSTERVSVDLGNVTSVRRGSAARPLMPTAKNNIAATA